MNNQNDYSTQTPNFKPQTVQHKEVSAESIAFALGGKRAGDGWSCKCPAHDDSNPSLSLNEKNGKVLVRCHAGCDQKSVIAALRERGLWSSVRTTKYPYVDADRGGVGLSVVRDEMPDGEKKILRSPAGFKGELLPYRFELWGDKKGRHILLVEGEKKAEVLIEQGFLATTLAGGCNGWKSPYAKYFAGHTVVILPDHDQPGRKFATAAFKDIKPVAASAKIVELPGLKDAEDVADWFESGKTPDDLKDLIKSAPADLPMSMVKPGSISWSAMTPVPSALPKAPILSDELAESMLPKSIRPWILDVATRLQVPVESVAACAIGSISSVVGRKVSIHPKRNDDWKVIPNLWAALVDRPGRKKTPTLDEAMKPLEALEESARKQFDDRRAKAKADSDVTKLKIDNTRDAIKAALKGNKSIDGLQVELTCLEKELESRAHVERRYRTSDATVEKLGELLNENPNGLLLKRDELSGWLRGLDRIGHEGDREFFLEAWNGNGKHRVDRIKRGSILVEAVCLTIIGGIQPGKLESYVAQACSGGSGDDGLLPRFQLLVYPERATTEPVYIDRKPNAEARSLAEQIFRKIDELNGESIAVRFDESAQVLVDEWLLNLERRLYHAHEMSLAFETHLSKYRKLMPALALLFHVVDWAAEKGTSVGSVGLESARMAAVWCDFLEGHAKKVYAITTNFEIFSAEAILKKIKDKKIRDGMKIRDIHRNNWSMLTTSDAVYGGMAVLESCGMVKVEIAYGEGAPTRLIRLHPDLIGEVAA